MGVYMVHVHVEAYCKVDWLQSSLGIEQIGSKLARVNSSNFHQPAKPISLIPRPLLAFQYLFLVQR